jgi:hypothetical protein
VSEERDFIAEMDERINELTKGSGWVAAIVASKLHAQLLESDPELLDGWLHVMATQMLRRMIGLRQSSERTTARRRAGGRAFAAAAERYASAEGGTETTGAALASLFRVTHVVDDENTQKRAADMTGPEHLFVAETEYERDAKRSMMLAAFHRAVAKKVGKRRTGDVLTEAQYDAMYRSIVRSPGNEAA